MILRLCYIYFSDNAEVSNKLLNDYHLNVKERKEFNEIYKKYQPRSVINNPEVYCSFSKSFALKYSGEHLPSIVLDVCIEQGFLIPDSRIGFIFNHNKEAVKIV